MLIIIYLVLAPGELKLESEHSSAIGFESTSDKFHSSDDDEVG